jgi:hypothetical protein
MGLSPPKYHPQKAGTANPVPASFCLHPASIGSKSCRWLWNSLLKFNPASLLQNCLQLADKRQGMTSVVPQMDQTDFGFSRCGIANN